MTAVVLPFRRPEVRAPRRPTETDAGWINRVRDEGGPPAIDRPEPVDVRAVLPSYTGPRE